MLLCQDRVRGARWSSGQAPEDRQTPAEGTINDPISHKMAVYKSASVFECHNALWCVIIEVLINYLFFLYHKAFCHKLVVSCTFAFIYTHTHTHTHSGSSTINDMINIWNHIQNHYSLSVQWVTLFLCTSMQSNVTLLRDMAVLIAQSFKNNPEKGNFFSLYK